MARGIALARAGKCGSIDFSDRHGAGAGSPS
jgi:hypothetical protein